MKKDCRRDREALVKKTDGAQPVAAAIEREKAAVTAGNWADYLAVLTDDAVFMPPNSLSKSGEELRTWLSSFVQGFQVEWLSFATTDLEVVQDLAYHTFTYTWRVTPHAGGEGKVSSGKGLHVLRRQADGPWKIAREIWNSVPS
jgi:ketosteroid isomerase-like protein